MDGKPRLAGAMARFRFRFRIKNLLIVVALVAAFMATFEGGRRWERRGKYAGVTIPSTPYRPGSVQAYVPPPGQ